MAWVRWSVPPFLRQKMQLLWLYFIGLLCECLGGVQMLQQLNGMDFRNIHTPVICARRLEDCAKIPAFP